MNKKALLVISFGTSYADTREKTITATENALVHIFPDYNLKRAFTSQVVIDKLKKRDGIVIDNVTQAIEKLYVEGYQEILVQPLHVIPGVEYESAIDELTPFMQKFARLTVGAPLLAHPEDYETVVNALCGELPKTSNAEAVVFMGHGSSHPANAAYSKLERVFKGKGYSNVYIATVEGTPKLESVIESLKADEIQKVTLIPFMFVAGDHALNDMAGDSQESWKSILERKGYTVDVRLVGLGEIEKIRQIYIAHAQSAMECNWP
jgi:sirohydrochlorin cobaltochelatase